MSYILEALKKAEQQRELGRVPGIDSVHEQAHGGARGRWLWVVTGVLILNAAVLLVLFWPDQRQDVGVDAAIELEPARQTAAYQAAAISERRESSAAAQVEEREAPNEVSVQPQLSAQTLNELRQPGEVASPVALDDAAIPHPAREPAAKPDTAAQLPVWPQIPAYLFEQLSGSLRLDVHVFASEPAERFVLINLKKYHQGQQLQEGPRLDAITAEGVILSFGGERFRLQAQQ